MKFSVLMANYNNVAYLSQAIKSVINQTFKDWELIIIDDCSRDNSVEIIRSFSHDKRIKFFQNEKNMGYVATLKRMIDKSAAEIICIFDSDDILSHEALETVNKAYENHKECGFIYSQFAYCDKNLNFIKNGYCNYIPSGKTNLHCDCVSHFKTFKKREYIKTEGYDKNTIYSEDKDLIFKLEEVTKLYFIDKVLYKYRVLPNSQGNDPRKALLGKIYFMLIKFNAYKRRLGGDVPNLTRSEMTKELLRGVYYCIKAGEIKKTMFFIYNITKLQFARNQ